MDEFLSVGMTRYKAAKRTLVTFNKEIETLLQGILKNRKNWGSFAPDKTTVRSTTQGKNYAVLLSTIDGTINGEEVEIATDINWHESESEYPIYVVRFNPGWNTKAMAKFNWSNRVVWNDKIEGIELKPNKDDFAPERDFGVLLDELVRFLKSQKPKRAR